MKQRIPMFFIGLLLFAPALLAQTFSRNAIESALEDELFPLVEEQVWNTLSVRQTAEETANLTLLLIRALLGQERFDEAEILADESMHLPGQDAFIYWKARALFAAGKFKPVFQTLETLPKTSDYTPAALRLEGRTAIAIQDPKRTEKAFALFEDRFPEHEEAAQNLFDLADTQLASGRVRFAAKTMHELLKRFPDTVLADSVRLLLARELIAGNGKKEKKEAAGLLEQLGTDETAHARLRIAAWVELAALEQRKDRSDIAADALLNAENLTDQAALRARQKTARANLLLDDGKTKEAMPLFDEAIQAAPDDPLAADILLQKAEALLKIKQFDAAEKAFQSYLNVTQNPDGEIRALFGKGWSLWEQQRYEEAATAFENSASKDSDADRRITAWVKAGDARLAAKQAGIAAENYHHVSENNPEHSLAARALYQYSIALLAADKTQEAQHTFEKTEEQYPASDFAARAAIQRAEHLKQEKEWALALDEYRRIANQYTNATTQATAIHQQGLILFGFDRFDEALEKFHLVSKTYPESHVAPQATYMHGFCRYLQGDIETALEICRNFISTYPDSLWTPEVHFWLGEHAYNQGNYTQAQATFLDILARFPQNELADDALFWAGHSLLKQDSFLEAFTLYGRLAKEYPESELLLNTRFAQGEALSQLGEFSRAILAYEEAIKTDSDHPLADRARGRLGDCLFTLGTTETTRYQEALEAYQALYKRPNTPFALKLQSLYKIARCEEKMELPEKAFAHYIETVYMATNHNAPLSPDATLWFTRAALEAATQQEHKSQWQEAINIYQRIIEAGVPAKDEAAKRIKKIKTLPPQS